MNETQINQIKLLLRQSAHITKAKPTVFYKTGIGHYAEHDQFIGVNVPTLRKIAKNFQYLPLAEIQLLIASPINEERLLALIMLVLQYQAAILTSQTKDDIYNFYLDNLQYVNNWNLVDTSAHLIIGAHLFKRSKNLLLILARSSIMWERRIAIVATWYFIRNDSLTWTFKIAKVLLNDNHDLIHKAVGWMLREAGKRDQKQLIVFLDQYASKMPRTMLRYAIEKFPDHKRRIYLKHGKYKKCMAISANR